MIVNPSKIISQNYQTVDADGLAGGGNSVTSFNINDSNLPQYLWPRVPRKTTGPVYGLLHSATIELYTQDFQFSVISNNAFVWQWTSRTNAAFPHTSNIVFPVPIILTGICGARIDNLGAGAGDAFMTLQYTLHDMHE